ncbi:hypothetical protein HYE08_00835 [Mycoplasmopsis bovis]|nr:hypothetical protein [Mycoplasmopsis bovis]QQH26999.1 hypothetical protein HYE08_00835 [Mycoplasmopsis bovis]
MIPILVMYNNVPFKTVRFNDFVWLIQWKIWSELNQEVCKFNSLIVNARIKKIIDESKESKFSLSSDVSKSVNRTIFDELRIIAMTLILIYSDTNVMSVYFLFIYLECYLIYFLFV